MKIGKKSRSYLLNLLYLDLIVNYKDWVESEKSYRESIYKNATKNISISIHKNDGLPYVVCSFFEEYWKELKSSINLTIFEKRELNKYIKIFKILKALDNFKDGNFKGLVEKIKNKINRFEEEFEEEIK